MKDLSSIGSNTQVDELKAELEKAKSKKITFKDNALDTALFIPALALGIIILPFVVIGVIIDGVVRLFTLNEKPIIDY